MKKSILSLVLLAVLLLASCSQGKEPTFDFESSDGLSLYGMNLNYYIYEDSSTVLGLELNTSFGDLARQRIKDTESALDCKLTVFYGQISAYIENTVSAMSSSVDFFQQDIIYLASLARSGNLIGLKDMDTIDVRDSAKWGGRNLLETLCWNSDIYGVLPLTWPDLCYKNLGFVLMENTDLLSAAGVADLREKVEKGEWTWNGFRNSLTELTLTQEDKKQYALYAQYDEWFADMYCRTNGSSLWVRNGDSIDCGFFTEQGKKALQETMTLLREYKDCMSFSSSHTFLTKDCVMGIMHGMEFFNDVSKEIENYGILPYPTGPDVDKDYTFSITESVYFATGIPLSASEPDASAAVIDFLYAPLPGYETVDALKEYYTENFFYDPRDTDVYFSMFMNSQPNYFSEGGRKITEATTIPTLTVASLIEGYSASVEDVVTEYVIPEYNAADAIWAD